MRRLASIAVVVLWAALASGQVAAPSSRPPDPASPPVQPAPPPLPPDVKSPDAPPSPTDGNPVTRTLKRLAPNCINAVFHACWSSSPQKPQPPMTGERRAAASREVGEFYLEHRNYRAAESRFREALTYNPADSRAMFDLGQSLEKLSRFDDAIEEYRYCADSDPNSAYAPRCRKRLEVVSSRLGSVPKR